MHKAQWNYSCPVIRSYVTYIQVGFNAKQTFKFSNSGTYYNVSSIEAKRATPIGAKSDEDGALCLTLKCITIIINLDVVYDDEFVRHIRIHSTM